MNKILAKISGLLIMTFVLCTEANATHIIGGDITYKHIQGDKYEIAFTFRRDCITGDEDAQFDKQAIIWIFDDNGRLLPSYGLGGRIIMNLNPDDTLGRTFVSDCGFEGQQVCVQETEYKEIVRLPYRPGKGGYRLVYQRCCRNNTLANILEPEDTGGTWMTYLSEESLASQNSSPRFERWPEIYICEGNDLNFDHSAQDIDGDSLVYRLYTPLSGLSDARPIPFGPPYPPYTEVGWKSPYGLDNLLGGDPVTIDPKTGILTGKPNRVGQFLVGVVVEEYRNGRIIGYTRRDFQYNVRKCGAPPNADFIANDGVCKGKKVSFENISVSASQYRWNFNYPSTDPKYQSTEKNPMFEYDEEGVYQVQLIATRGVDSCRSTIVKKVAALTADITPDFSVQVDECRTNGDYTITLSDASKDNTPGQSINNQKWRVTQNGNTRTFEGNPFSLIVQPNGLIEVELLVTSTSSCSNKIVKTLDPKDFDHSASFTYALSECPEGDVAQIVLTSTSAASNPYDQPVLVKWIVSSNLGTRSFTGEVVTVDAKSNELMNVYMEVDFGGGCKAFADEEVRVSRLFPELNYFSRGVNCVNVDSATIAYVIDDSSRNLKLVESKSTVTSKAGDILIDTDKLQFEVVVPKNEEITLTIIGKYENGCVDTLKNTYTPGPFSDIQFTTNPRKICLGDTLPLLKAGDPSWTYTWEPTTHLFYPDPNDPSKVEAIGVEDITYVLTVTDGICTEKDTIKVEVLDGDNLTVRGDRIVCDNSVDLTVSGGIPPGNFEWATDPSFTNIIFTGANLKTTFRGGDATYYVRFTGETCGDDYVKIGVSKRIFNLDFGGDTVQVCKNDTISLLKNPNPKFTYVWDTNDALYFKNGDTRRPYIIGKTDRTIRVVVSDGKCVDTQSVRIDVLDKIDVVIKGETNICEGDDVNLYVDPIAGNGIFQWSESPDFKVIIAEGERLQLPLNKTTQNYYVRYTGDICGDPQSEIIVKRSVIDVDFLPPPIRLCKGDTIALVSNPNTKYSYEWSPKDGLIFADNDALFANPRLIVTKDIKYNVKVVDGNCSKDYELDIEVSDTRNITITGDTLLCDDNVELTASGADGNGDYEWSDSPDFDVILAQGTTLKIEQVKDEKTYYVRFTDRACGEQYASKKVSRYKFDLLVISDYPVCYGDTLVDYTIINEGSGIISYKWDDDPHIIAGGNTNNPTIVFSANDQDTVRLYFTATTDAGCMTQREVVFLVNPPVDVDFEYDLTKCGDLELCFKPIGRFTGFLQWNFGDPSSENNISYSDSSCHTFTKAGTYTVQLSNLTSSCVFKPIEKTIVVNDSIQILDIPSQKGCIGETIEIIPSSPNIGISYKWYTLGGDTLANNNTLSTIINKKDSIIVEGTDPNNCSARDTIILDPYEYSTEVTLPKVLCSDDPKAVNLKVQGGSGKYEYDWSPAIIVKEGSNTATPKIAITKDERLKVKVTDIEHGCTIEDSYLLTFERITIDIEANPDVTINRGQSIELTVDPDDADFSYMWSTGSTESTITVTPEMDTTYFVKVTDKDGCMDTDTINITIRQPKCDESDVFLPTAFSPNGDNKNDVLYVRSAFVDKMELIIYNRWGQEMFRSNDQKKGWDGTFNGSTLAPDSYAYYLNVICVNGFTYSKRGNVNLLR